MILAALLPLASKRGQARRGYSRRLYRHRDDAKFDGQTSSGATHCTTAFAPPAVEDASGVPSVNTEYLACMLSGLFQLRIAVHWLTIVRPAR
jgi:hypothetical protein